MSPAASTATAELPAPIRQLEKALGDRVDALLEAPSPTRLLEVAETTFDLKQAGFARVADASLRHMLETLRARGGSEMADAAQFLLVRNGGSIEDARPAPDQTPVEEDRPLAEPPVAAHPMETNRNLGLVAPSLAAKKAVLEQFAACADQPPKADEDPFGGGGMDWMDAVQDRKADPVPAVTTTSWNDRRLNILDTPERVDLATELDRGLRALDGLVTVLDGADGVEPEIEAIWREADKRPVPRIVFVDGMDKSGADLDRSVASIHHRLGVRAWPIQLPIGSGAGLKGLVDLVRMKAVVWDGGAPAGGAREEEIPSELWGKAAAARADLIQALVDHGRGAKEPFLRGQTPSEGALRRGLRRAVLTGDFHPVLCGSTGKAIGVQPLLDAVVDLLPSPMDVAPARGADFKTGGEIIRKASEAEPLSALVFRVVQDPLAGSLALCRIYSGRIDAGMTLLNTARDQRERVQRILLMQADAKADIKQARAGDIVALAGLKTTFTGDTLCDPLKSPVVLAYTAPPPQVIEVAVEPRSLSDEERLRGALQTMATDDPSLGVSYEGSGKGPRRFILKGASEQHLEAKFDHLKRVFGLIPQVGTPRAAYQETISRQATVDYTHKKQSGGAAQFARVKIAFEPGKPGTGFVFETAIVDGDVPREFIPGVQRGLEAMRGGGLLAGFPVVDFKATLVGGLANDDSSFLAFELAARAALKELGGKGQPQLLEPIMKIEITAPEEHLGVVLGDLGARRGVVQALDRRGPAAVATALVPQAELFGYAQDLRNLSQGLARFTLIYHHYAPMPDHIAERIVSRLG